MSGSTDTLKKIDIKNNRLDNIPELNLRGNIDSFDAFFISDQISNLTKPGTDQPSKELRLNINSFGGSVMQAFTIVSAMQNFMNAGGEIETINEGRADSAASWIFALGTRGRRKMMQFAGVFVHPPVLEDGTEIKDLPVDDPQRKEMESVFDKLVNIFVATTGKEFNRIKRLMQNNTDMDANQALKEGFADVRIMVDNVPKIKNTVNRAALVEIYNSLEYEITGETTTTTNKIETPEPPAKPKFRMSVLAGLLNLNAEASQDAIRQEIEKVLNQNRSLDSDLKNAKSELEKVTSERDTLKNKLSKLEDAEIVNYVDQVIKADATKKDQRDNLINMAKSGGLETFKTLVPVKKEIENGADISDGAEEEPNSTGTNGANTALKNKAEKFKALSYKDKQSLKISNYSEFSDLAEAYDQYYSNPVTK